MKIEELKNKISHARQVYYNTDGSRQAADDIVYDGWIAELKQLAPNDPLLKEIGAPIPRSTKAQKIVHRHPMGSLHNAMSEDEFLAWVHETRMHWRGETHPTFNLSFKMDGCSGALYYEKGLLVSAGTRGNGQVGESILANALQMKGVVRFLPNEFTGSVRGEIMLFKKDWREIDPDRLSPNPRNLGNGIARRLDGENCERLHFVAFRLFNKAGRAVDPAMLMGSEREEGMIRELSHMGFTPVFSIPECTAEEVLEAYRWMQGIKAQPPIEKLPLRDDLPFEIDGLVIKVESLMFQQEHDLDPLLPCSQIALKFPARTGKTKMTGVDITVGHTGAIIPTAILDPIEIGGVVVTAASLYNFDEIARLDIAIGDIVEVARSGDVIPKVLRVIERPAGRISIETPSKCPITGGPVAKRSNVDGTESVHLYSLSADNPAIKKGKILRWLSSLEILGLGEAWVDKLYEAGVVADVSHLYHIMQCQTLAPNPVVNNICEDFVDILGEKAAAKVIDEIRRKSKLTISEFLGSLGIDGLGKRRVLLIQKSCPGAFDTLGDWRSDKLIRLADKAGVPNLCWSINRQIQEASDLIDSLLQRGVEIVASKKPESVKANALVFCITGRLSQPKEYFHGLITKAGHLFEEDYRKGISFLVAADPGSGSSKMKKAAKDGVPVINETQLLDLLGQ